MLEKNKRQVVECFSRAMGFVRPISFFNIGKRQEFEDRKLFKESKSLKKNRKDGNIK